MSKIGVISIYPFPLGLAATNRIIAYSKGIVDLNNVVEVVCLVPTDCGANNEFGDRGEYFGISYIYPAGRRKASNKIFRGLSIFSGYRYFRGVISALRYMIKSSRELKYDAIIISTDSLPYLFIFSSLAKWLRCKSLFIFDEYPTPIRHKLKERIPYLKELAYSYVLRRIDGYIAISENINRYYCSLCPKPNIILPIIIDTNRFKFNGKSKPNGHIKYLCYMGNMELSKDNIDIIIKSFVEISNRYPDLFLYLYGKPSTDNLNKIKKLILLLGLEDKVIYKGCVSSIEVPNILNSAFILVSSQPETIRATGGFPTKLGEYLCSGIPTVMTDVGENSKYVIDGVHCYFVPPNDVDRYAEKLDYIINNYSEALDVASEGRKFVMNNFSSIAAGRKILDFIDRLYY